MPRFRKYITNAEKQAAFRMQHPDLTRTLSDDTKTKNRERAALWRKQNPTEVKKDLQRVKQWAKDNPDSIRESKRRYEHNVKLNQPFIALDGEGVNREDGTHDYTLLASSLGKSVENWNYGGLSTEACFRFIWSHLDKGILVGFGFNYDINMMLGDLSALEVATLWKRKELDWNGWHITWLKSKMFSLSRDGRKITIFETFGFFQASFVQTLIDWNMIKGEKVIGKKVVEKGDDTFYMLSENKANRSTFTAKERIKIKSYNNSECELLVELMSRLRKATIEADCVPKSWHGAAAIAKALAKKYNVQQYIHQPEALKIKFLRAYYGGRSQVLLQGEFPNAYGHDVSSAYPAALRSLPTSKGKWYKTTEYRPNQEWALYHVKWKTPTKEYLNPFPVRWKGEIYYPNKGEGWYWKPEIDVALKYYKKYIEVIEGLYLVPECDVKPYSFIDDIYAQRMKFKREGNDAQKALKLGMNSLYGITAQSIGWNGQPPPLQNYFFAGYVTSTCRAKVLALAYPHKKSIVAFATDGVFATERLTDDVLGLGGWETDQIDNLFMIQSGVYAFGFEGDEAKEVKKKSRGFHKASVNYDELRALWRKEGNMGKYKYYETRFRGIGNSLPSLKNWREWIECERTISFTISDQFNEEQNGVLRIYPDMPHCVMSEAYEPHKSWQEKDAMIGETHCE